MNCKCFEIDPNSSSDEVWESMMLQGFELLYADEEPGLSIKFYGHAPTKAWVIPEIIGVTEVHFDEIDWQAQWSESTGSESGIVQFDLSRYFSGCKHLLELHPGPGFGDLSHPTTLLTLQEMHSSVKDRFVLDIGCGSGVLSLAAIYAGACAAHGIDIDPLAIEHANRNALCNQLQDQVSFGLPETDFQAPQNAPWLVVMNMVSSEQQAAWRGLSQRIQTPCVIITSGVLKEQMDEYRSLVESWGWNYISHQELEGWLVFRWELIQSKRNTLQTT